jgi:S-DNA-T family DNA segregation ATPase FtsK/SpoIIIE
LAKAKNSVKGAAEKKTSKKSPKKRSTGNSDNLKALKLFIKDKRVRQIFGGFLCIISLYITISCLSYVTAGKHDLRLILDASELTGNESFSNVMGKSGAHTAYFFMNQLFGIAALFIPFYVFLLGAKAFSGKTLLPLVKTLRLSLFGILLLPIVIGFFFHQAIPGTDHAVELTCNENMVGAYGYFMTVWTSYTFGWIGTLLVLMFVVGAAVIFNLSGPLQFLQKKLQAIWSSSDDEDDESTVEETDPHGNRLKNEAEPEEVEADPTQDVLEELIEENEVPFALETEVEEAVEEVVEEPQPEEEPKIELETEVPEPEPVVESGDDSDLAIAETAEEKELSEDELDDLVQEFGEYDPKLDLSHYELPGIDLLKQYSTGELSIDKAELEANKNKIVETLNNYKIEISKIMATIGPTVTLYEIVPAPGVRISKIKNLEDDIALSLAALGIRIIAPIPGKGTIGIEVPNSKPDIVSMKSLIASEKFQNSGFELPIAIGKTISNETFVADLAKMPHLLMAGATGQGKSVGLNAILVSLLYKKHPSQIKFVLVDPKKVELTLFNKIERHFLAKLPDDGEAIITDTSLVVKTLNSLCVEMDTRYELLKTAHCRNLKEYNAKFVKRKLNPENGHKYMPYIVLVVDEFADLIMTAGKEVEQPIARLAQLARAIGIHLIIATQRPSVNIITGTIKANFPARIAFRVTSKIDSRTILDAGGADQLIGRGDMLLSTGNELIRLQCGFVDTPEVEEICDFIGAQQAYPSAFLLPEYIDESASEIGNIADEDRDVLFEDAARVIVLHQQGSASLLQRKLKLGYNRAGRLIDQLEAAGIIGPFKGSKAREVLIPDEYSLEQFLNGGVEKQEL